ncbi:YecA family protein [Gordoniibacillus kamchatkensis]|uniref:YecA family protein n=1 Tax=Gordoniibacillus kamchatkensis TaxID=1590651 RepID=UPI000697E37E|nr:SEC-C metal-binding domain-containing protein [Paenibacillus sp. VKM B-2647]
MTTTIGRNDPCPCGSGKKYKKCHGLMQVLSWNDVMAQVHFSHAQRNKIERAFLAANEDFKEHPLAGACHLLSGVFSVVLAELGVSAALKLGVVRRTIDGRDFTHSWIEIDGYVFDVAIQHTLHGEINAPVFAGIDVSNGLPAPFIYGIDREPDEIGLDVLRTPFGKYMDQCPFYEDGGWSIVHRIASKMGLVTDIQTLRSKYSRMKRIPVMYRVQSPVAAHSQFTQAK